MASRSVASLNSPALADVELALDLVRHHRAVAQNDDARLGPHELAESPETTPQEKPRQRAPPIAEIVAKRLVEYLTELASS